MGRKSLQPEGGQTNRWVKLRLTEAAELAWRAAATKKGYKTLGKWMRETLDRAAKRAGK